MARATGHAPASEQARPGTRGRSDTMLVVLAAVTLVLIAVQFAAAGFGAFAMGKTPTDNVYNAHVVLGLVTAVMTLLILGAVLASQTARKHRRTLWLAVTLAVLTVLGQPLLGEGGKHVPAVGSVHALNGLAIAAVLAWLTLETARRRAVTRLPGEGNVADG
jgi:hypothetical protein